MKTPLTQSVKDLILPDDTSGLIKKGGRKMVLKNKVLGLIGIFSFLLSGCVVRTYSQVRDRIDQDLNSGNRGYMQGKIPPQEVSNRPTTRTTRVVEIELHPPLKIEKAKPETKIQEPIVEEAGVAPKGTVAVSATTTKATKTYTVQKSDTLQKISSKFYGTTKKWTKIYNANRDKLKSPEKIYPGQVLVIP